MITRRLQFDAVKYGILHTNQLGGVSQQSTEDASVFLTHLVQASQAKNLKTSIIAFDIAQFFPSSYLVGIYTQYSCNSFFFGACDTDVDVGQGSVLSSIISVLYIASLICVFEHRA